MDSITSLIRNTEEIEKIYSGKFQINSSVKSCVFAVIKNKQKSYESGLFIITPKSMFRRPKLIKVIPITYEFHILPGKEGFLLAWGESFKQISEIFAPDDLIRHLVDSCNDYSRYQEEPFHKSSSHHKWIWFYEEFIPPIMHAPSSSIHRGRSLHFSHYGKAIMNAYIDEELRKQESCFTKKQTLRVEVLTWNAAGLQPSGSVEFWLGCSNERFPLKVEPPDFIVVGLQEMCELSKLLGDSLREAEWAGFLKQQILSTFNEEYVKMHQAALVGLMNIAFVKKNVSQLVSGLAFQQIKLGLKGITGNKGALAFRFEVEGSSFCFINVHLAAHKQYLKTRNESLAYVSRNLKFQVGKSLLSVIEHENVYWFGDFNYRIDELTNEQIVKKLRSGEREACLAFDQLILAKKSGQVLADYMEGEIRFNPTFKFVIGTNEYNPKREPAWCDRVLFKGSELMRYDSCDTITFSDHKPVFSYFSVTIKSTIEEEKTKLIDKIQKEIEEKHTEATPKIQVSNSVLDFGEIRYRIREQRTVEIKNSGFSEVNIVVKTGSWVKCEPSSCLLLENQVVVITVFICIESDLLKAYRENKDSQRFLKILVRNGKEEIIGLKFSIIDTFIGYSCQDLCKTRPSKLSMHLPEPIVKLVQFLQRRVIKVKTLAEKQVQSAALARIIKIIDDEGELDNSIDPYEVIHVICEFFRNLPEPLIDVRLVDSKVNMLNFIGFEIVKHQIYDDIKEENGQVLRYLIDYLKYLIDRSEDSEINAHYLSVKLYKVLFQVKNLTEQEKKHRVLFLEILFK